MHAHAPGPTMPKTATPTTWPCKPGTKVRHISAAMLLKACLDDTNPDRGWWMADLWRFWREETEDERDG